MTGLTKGKQLRFTIRNVRGLSDSGKRNYTDREIEDQKIFRQELRRFAKKKNLRKKNRDTLNVKEKKIMREDGKHRTEYMKRNGEIGRAGSMWLCTRASTWLHKKTSE